jgi:tetratricopeptide (TPR) repeat protein
MEDNKFSSVLLGSKSLAQANNSVAVTSKLILESNTRTRKKAEYLFGAADQASRDGEHEIAIDLYTIAIEVDSNYYNAYSQRGFQRQIIKDYEGALSDYSKVIRDLPLNFEVFSVYSRRANLNRLLKDFIGEIEDLTKLIEIDPNNPWLFQDRAKAKRETGDFKGAELDLAIYNQFDKNEYGL